MFLYAQSKSPIYFIFRIMSWTILLPTSLFLDSAQTRALSIVIGLITFTYGMVTFKSRLAKISNLQARGIPITANISKITLDISAIHIYKYSLYKLITDTNYYNYRIYCMGLNPFTKSSQEFVSDKLQFEPILDLDTNRNITVFVGRDDYYVDISGIRVKRPSIGEVGRYESYNGKNYRRISWIP